RCDHSTPRTNRRCNGEDAHGRAPGRRHRVPPDSDADDDEDLMLNLIKNLKVGTKLILILAPPVIVLIVLSVLGFQQRSADSVEARRADDRAQVASDTSRLSEARELQGLVTAEFRAGADDDPELTAKLEERRAAPDAA